MELLEKHLKVKTSTLPGSGKGLFTTKFIAKGTRILEYKGKITTWKDVDHEEGNNGYLLFVNRKHVIDASKDKTVLARYTNDARGIKKIKGLLNNAGYTMEGTRVFVEAIKDIPANTEIFVSYGKDYWDAMRSNRKLDTQRTRV